VIVVFGSINADLVIAAPRLPMPGETVIGDSYRLMPGGTGANQALAAARDGATVSLVGAVGHDPFAETALALLRGARIDLSLLRVVDLPTGCAAITVSATGENLITVAAGANQRAAAEMVPERMLGPDTILLMQMEVPGREVASLAARAKRSGSRVILNLAPAAPLDEATARCIDILIANEGEAALLGPELGASAAALGNVIVVTRGSRGASAYLPDGGSIDTPALPVDVVDTTGAGDTFVGVLAASLDNGGDLAGSLRRASAAAGVACRMPGAQPSMPSREAIDDAVRRLCRAMP
jgi:ribokinase